MAKNVISGGVRKAHNGFYVCCDFRNRYTGKVERNFKFVTSEKKVKAEINAEIEHLKARLEMMEKILADFENNT